MPRPGSPSLFALLLVLGASAGVADDTAFRRDQKVRIRAGDTSEIPGVVTLGPSLVARGRLVRSDDRLVAVAVPGEPIAQCLPRPRATLTGQLLATDAETLTIRFDGQKDAFRVPRYAIASVERRVGHKGSRGRNALVGLLAGAAIGALVGAATGSNDDFIEPGAIVAGSAALFGALGAGVGAVLPLEEVWERVPLDQQARGDLRVPPHRRRGISLTLAF